MTLVAVMIECVAPGLKNNLQIPVDLSSSGRISIPGSTFLRELYLVRFKILDTQGGTFGSEWAIHTGEEDSILD